MKAIIEQEERGKVEAVFGRFRGELSEKQILIAGAQAINHVLTRSVSRINKQIKKEYNVRPRRLSKMVQVSPKANSGTLWGGIRINTGNIPIYDFKPKQSGSGVSVAVHKGKTVYVNNSFLATMSSGHTGVYSRGRYKKREGFVPGREKTESGKIRITEILTASPFTMAMSKEVAADAQQYMGEELPTRTAAILQSKVDKLAR
ncbi:MAG: phage tail protein [Alistipes sp.]|nr:phage tail protein [Alistipes sp.]